LILHVNIRTNVFIKIYCVATDELVEVAIAVIALKYYVSAYMFQVKYIRIFWGSLYTTWMVVALNHIV